MTWSFKKVFYGNAGGLSVRHIKEFLAQGYCAIPYTLFEGYYKAVHRVGDHDGLYARIEKPFPDAIVVQKPEGPFAMHFSGGYDSALLAKLYDSEGVDYIHFVGPDSPKARALAATLKGTLHEITVTPEMFIRTGEKLLPQLREPYAFHDVIFAYLASEKAKQLGHTLIVTGDGGDGLFGGYTIGTGSGELAEVLWKTLEPHHLLGLQTFQPLMHTALKTWSERTLAPHQKTPEKLFLRDYFRELGMPDEVTNQAKVPWAGSIGIREDTTVNDHMRATIEASDYRWITEFTYPTPTAVAVLFRQYGLVKWLEAHYKKELAAAEIRAFSQRVREINAVDEDEARQTNRKERIKRFVPPVMVQAVRAMRR